MSNDPKISSSMENSYQKSKQEESGSPSLPKVYTSSDFDTALECLHHVGIFQHPFLVFLNYQEQSGGKKRLKYGGIKKGRQLFKPSGSPSLASHWDALAKAEMEVSESVESKHFLETAALAASTPKELAAYFQQPHANTWQENELAICQAVMGNAEGHLYISFPFPASAPAGVAHIVFNKKDKAPHVDQISKCF